MNIIITMCIFLLLLSPSVQAQEILPDDSCASVAELRAALEEARATQEMLKAELAETRLELAAARLAAKALQDDVEELQRHTQYKETSPAKRLIEALWFGQTHDSELADQSREVQP